MSDRFPGELDPFEVTVTASVVAERNDSVVMRATVENGTGAEGGEVRVCVTDTARYAYGLEGCVAELERFLNSTLRPEFRLDAALAMGEQGAFSVVATPDTGPRVVIPATPEFLDLAA